MSLAFGTSPRVRPIVLVMGPSGSGKSEIGRALAARLGVTFIDADDLHSTAARAKMSSGQGLTDLDRAPWLERIGELFSGARVAGTGIVVACSALKRAYRDGFRDACSELVTFELDVPADVLAQRIRDRASHFVTVDLLPSQLADLEPLDVDELGVRIPAVQSPQAVVGEAISALENLRLN